MQENMYYSREIPSSSFETADRNTTCVNEFRLLPCRRSSAELRSILQLLPYPTLPVVNLFWLAGVFLAWADLGNLHQVGRAESEGGQRISKTYTATEFRGL